MKHGLATTIAATTHALDGRTYILELAPETPPNSFAPATPDQAESLSLGTVHGTTGGGGR